MFVTNHVLSGVVIGRLLERRPISAFFVGLASHLVLDAVPHWGCALTAEADRHRFHRYAQRDGLLGLAAAFGVVVAVDGRSRPATLAAIAGTVLLDADKPMVHFLRRNAFPRVVRRIHARVQRESRQGMPIEVAFGLSFALADAAIAVHGRRRHPRVAA
ncbi:MAG TPA: hypothetical protein VEG62_08760 [Acidimicrobiales bacterium]|nr:hypothetical protein [Acidimicrobiales bacterium]HXZ62820.1 hypothetical protein [Acidimicrobiales bacterium]